MFWRWPTSDIHAAITEADVGKPVAMFSPAADQR
jgi:hypothetical protein